MTSSYKTSRAESDRKYQSKPEVRQALNARRRAVRRARKRALTLAAGGLTKQRVQLTS